MSRVVWAEAALADFDQLDTFYSRYSLTFSRRVGEQATRAARFLAENPMLGPAIEHGLRKWRVPTTDYVLLYRVTNDGVEVVRLIDARTGWRTDP